MATKKAIKKLKTKKTTKRVYKRTPKKHKISKAKAVTNFYGEFIAKSKLHKKLGIPRTEKIPLSVLKAQLAKFKNKKKKTAAELKEEREILFAINARKWSKKK